MLIFSFIIELTLPISNSAKQLQDKNICHDV